MDKWDELIEQLKRAILAEEADAAIVAGLSFFVEFGRALELLAQDTDRLATAAEGLLEAAKKSAETAKL